MKLYGIIIINFYILLFVSCYRDDNYEIFNQSPLDNILLNVESDDVPANGKSTVSITMTGFPVEIKEEINNITLETTDGFFGDSKKSITIKSFLVYDTLLGAYKRIATSKLYSPLDSAFASIKATVSGLTIEKKIRFSYVYPDSIKILIKSPYIRPSFDTPFLVEVKLLKSGSIPSLRNRVGVIAVNEKNESVGKFIEINDSSDSLGLCRFNYFISDTALIGKSIVLKSFLDFNPLIRDSITVLLY